MCVVHVHVQPVCATTIFICVYECVLVNTHGLEASS